LTYGLPLLLLFAILARALLKRRKGKVLIKPDLRAQKWARSLDRAEKILKRQGFVRMPGETVGTFLVRIESQVSDAGDVLSAVKSLREYEKHRWKK